MFSSDIGFNSFIGSIHLIDILLLKPSDQAPLDRGVSLKQDMLNHFTEEVFRQDMNFLNPRSMATLHHQGQIYQPEHLPPVSP